MHTLTASPSWKHRKTCHSRLTSPGSPRWPTSPRQPCSPTQIDRQTVNFLHTTPHPLPARAPALPVRKPPPTTYGPDFRRIGLGAKQVPTRSVRANSHPRKDTTTNHVGSRLSPHRAWEPSKNPHNPSWQIGTPGSAGALAGPSLHSCLPLPSGNTAKLTTRATTEPQTGAGRNPDNWHHQGTHTYVADARALLHRLRLITTDSRASHSEGKPS